MPKPKLTKRQTQAQNTKSTIYKAAMQLMDKKGFSNTTIEEISKKAKVSVGTFYLYYKSKDDIFQDVYHKADSYFKKEVSSQLAGKEAFDQIIFFFNTMRNTTRQEAWMPFPISTTPKTNSSSPKTAICLCF